MPATLLVAAHGTRSAAGLATTRALVAAVTAARPSVPVSLCFLDVAAPPLDAALAELGPSPVVVVPLLLSSGYHVQTDIPAAVAGHPSVRVAAHLGPDPLIVSAVAARLAAVSRGSATTLLAAIGSSRADARAEVATAADRLAALLGRPVSVLSLSASLDADVAAFAGPLDVAVYLLADGGFLSALRKALGGRGVVADPIGVHPALVALVWARYDAAAG